MNLTLFVSKVISTTAGIQLLLLDSIWILLQKIIRVKTIVRYVLNIVKNSWLPANGTDMQTFKDYLYEYDLDIDRDGQIIAGDWISKVRPDFLWLVNPATEFGGTFIKLRRLLNDKRVVRP